MLNENSLIWSVKLGMDPPLIAYIYPADNNAKPRSRPERGATGECPGSIIVEWDERSLRLRIAPNLVLRSGSPQLEERANEVESLVQRYGEKARPEQ